MTKILNDIEYICIFDIQRINYSYLQIINILKEILYIIVLSKWKTNLMKLQKNTK
jgi:hypothetical protein